MSAQKDGREEEVLRSYTNVESVPKRDFHETLSVYDVLRAAFFSTGPGGERKK